MVELRDPRFQSYALGATQIQLPPSALCSQEIPPPPGNGHLPGGLLLHIVVRGEWGLLPMRAENPVTLDVVVGNLMAAEWRRSWPPALPRALVGRG